MPKTKFGVGKNVSTDSGFAPYEGPLPKPGVVYNVEQKQAAFKKSGEKAKNPGVVYINSLWEVTDGECKGFTTWHRVVPGDSEMQQTRVAQYMQTVTGKNEADILYDKDEADPDTGKITKIGGRNPAGVKGRASFQRRRDNFNVVDGEEAPWTAEISDLIVGGRPKPDEVEDAEEDEEDLEEPEEELEDEDVEEGDEDDEEPEDDDSEESDEDEDAVSYEAASKMSLAELKALATEWESELDLSKYRGPKGKKALLAALVDEEIVEAEGDEEPPF